MEERDRIVNTHVERTGPEISLSKGLTVWRVVEGRSMKGYVEGDVKAGNMGAYWSPAPILWWVELLSEIRKDEDRGCGPGERIAPDFSALLEKQ